MDLLSLHRSWQIPTIILFGAFILSGLASCESPANVSADRKVTREYDPSLTDERLRIEGYRQLYLGNYTPYGDTVYTFSIQNISGSSYDINSVEIFGYSDTEIAAFDIVHQKLPLTLSSGSSDNIFLIHVVESDLNAITQASGEYDIDVKVIGGIDTIDFSFSYDLPQMVTHVSYDKNPLLNSTTTVSIEVHNFSNITHVMKSPSVVPAGNELTLTNSSLYPFTIEPQRSKTIQYLFRPTIAGDYDYVVNLDYERSTRGLPKTIELEFDVSP